MLAILIILDIAAIATFLVAAEYDMKVATKGGQAGT
ncbi:hypothetical protein ROTO_34300 [Roseovarius tolerans]|uniref:Uncharacterized protein n=1 Tax=Roseovarius tolerans TaxID=74031 RepID=A0A0L6CR84_9RHOB|nr:hypothetical protein ROTO_34300 [Roseovarius tolerans]